MVYHFNGETLTSARNLNAPTTSLFLYLFINQPDISRVYFIQYEVTGFLSSSMVKYQ